MSATATLPVATGPVPEPVRAELAMAEIGRRILDEDNRATGHPIYLVEQRERIYGLTADYTETFVWVDGEGEVEDDLAESLEAGHRAGASAPRDFRRVGYRDIWVFATACFTEEAANEYIRANGHNLRSPRIYVASAFRNREWQDVRAFAKALAKKGEGDAEE